uniref:Uncharacterized protein n=1 Tax=Tetranychus urticae TaxID=32264 RepID=T1KMR5_TETUR
MEQNNNSDKIFDQLESLTGIPIKYKTLFRLLEARPNLRGDYPNDEIWFRNDGGVHRRYLYFHNNRDPPFNDIRFNCDFVKDKCIHIGIGYALVPEIDVAEGVCTGIKDLVTNEELNSQISHRVQPLEENMQHNDDSEDELNKAYEEYNVRQFLRNHCHFYQWRWEDEEEGVNITINLEQYQRMRG